MAFQSKKFLKPKKYRLKTLMKGMEPVIIKKALKMIFDKTYFYNSSLPGFSIAGQGQKIGNRRHLWIYR